MSKRVLVHLKHLCLFYFFGSILCGLAFFYVCVCVFLSVCPVIRCFFFLMYFRLLVCLYVETFMGPLVHIFCCLFFWLACWLVGCMFGLAFLFCLGILLLLFLLSVGMVGAWLVIYLVLFKLLANTFISFWHELGLNL